MASSGSQDNQHQKTPPSTQPERAVPGSPASASARKRVRARGGSEARGEQARERGAGTRGETNEASLKESSQTLEQHVARVYGKAKAPGKQLRTLRFPNS